MQLICSSIHPKQPFLPNIHATMCITNQLHAHIHTLTYNYRHTCNATEPAFDLHDSGTCTTASSFWQLTLWNHQNWDYICKICLHAQYGTHACVHARVWCRGVGQWWEGGGRWVCVAVCVWGGGGTGRDMVGGGGGGSLYSCKHQMRGERCMQYTVTCKHCWVFLSSFGKSYVTT